MAGTDKTITIDLNALTEKGLGELIKVKKEIVSKLDKKGKRPKKRPSKEKIEQLDKKQEDKFKKKRLKEEEAKKAEKVFGKSGVQQLVNIGKNPKGFVIGQLFSIIPQLSIIIGTTAIIMKITKKLDDFNKKFIDFVAERDAFRTLQERALLDAGLTQEIFSTSTGSIESRDTYNSLQQFRDGERIQETDYQLDNIGGID